LPNFAITDSLLAIDSHSVICESTTSRRQHIFIFLDQVS
jgi:hypothetical protein